MATRNAQASLGAATYQEATARHWIRGVLRFARVHPLGAFGAVVMLVLILMAIAPALFTPFESQDPLRQQLRERLQGPSMTHWFGTDALGRDLYSRLVYGARSAMVIGFLVVVLTSALALVSGTLSGYLGGKFDMFFQRIIDIGIAIPGLVFVILAVVTLRDYIGDRYAIVLALAPLLAASQSRTIRGVALSLRNEQYVDAARSLGATDLRIMVRHIVPNLFAIVIVTASILVGAAVLVEAALSFLGYGVQPPTPSWGRELSDARANLTRAPHVVIFPTLMIFFTVYSFNMLGDALRDELDPRLRGSR